MFDCSTMMFGSRTAQVIENIELFVMFDLFGYFRANCYREIWEGGPSAGLSPDTPQEHELFL